MRKRNEGSLGKAPWGTPMTLLLHNLRLPIDSHAAASGNSRRNGRMDFQLIHILRRLVPERRGECSTTPSTQVEVEVIVVVVAVVVVVVVVAVVVRYPASCGGARSSTSKLVCALNQMVRRSKQNGDTLVGLNQMVRRFCQIDVRRVV